MLQACDCASSVDNLCSNCFWGNILSSFLWVGFIGEEVDWGSGVRVISKSSSLVLGGLECFGNIPLLKALTQPVNIGPQDVPRAFSSSNYRASLKYPIWPSRGRPDLKSWIQTNLPGTSLRRRSQDFPQRTCKRRLREVVGSFVVPQFHFTFPS